MYDMYPYICIVTRHVKIRNVSGYITQITSTCRGKLAKMNKSIRKILLRSRIYNTVRQHILVKKKWCPKISVHKGSIFQVISGQNSYTGTMNSFSPLSSKYKSDILRKLFLIIIYLMGL